MSNKELTFDASWSQSHFFGILLQKPEGKGLVLHGIDLGKERLFKDEPYNVIDFPTVETGKYLIRSKKLMHFAGKLILMSFVESEGPVPHTENSYIIFRNDEGEIKMTNIASVSTLLP